MRWRIDISSEMLELLPGEIIPIGYGLAYRDYCTNCGVFYLIPFNWIVRFMRFIHFKLKAPSIRFWEREASWPNQPKSK